MEAIRLLLAGLVVVGGVGLGATRDAQGQNTAALGGSGGSSYTIQCNDGEILTGIRVDAGMWVDRVTPRCARGASIFGGTWDGNKLHPRSAGKTHFGTRQQDADCPSGYAVKGFTVEYGSYVNSIVLTCRKLGRSWRTTSTASTLNRVGGSKASNQRSQTCREDMPARGIHGKAGEYLDSFGLVCGYILPIPPLPQAPINGIRVQNSRPTFYWSTVVGRALGTSTICMNLTANAPCSAPGTYRAEVHVTTTQWTPPEDLPFRAGDRVYWSVSACNDNACRSRSAYFIR